MKVIRRKQRTKITRNEVLYDIDFANGSDFSAKALYQKYHWDGKRAKSILTEIASLHGIFGATFNDNPYKEGKSSELESKPNDS